MLLYTGASCAPACSFSCNCHLLGGAAAYNWQRSQEAQGAAPALQDAGMAMPGAALATAPGFSMRLTLQRMDTRNAVAYASSSTQLGSCLTKSQLLRL